MSDGAYPWSDEVYTETGVEYRDFFGGSMTELLDELRAQAQQYAEQRDFHAAEASRLAAAADTHRIASQQFAGAHNAALASLAAVEKYLKAPGPADVR